MLFPKKVKYRKWQTMRKNPKKMGPATRGIAVSFGSHGLRAMAPNRITSNQIESARKAITKHVGKTGRVWIRVFPDRPFTKKPAEVKMGKGKGDIEGYCAKVSAGQIMFEVDGVTDIVAVESLRKGGTKMPMKTKIIARE